MFAPNRLYCYAFTYVHKNGKEMCVCVCSVTATTFSPQCCSAVIPESANSQGRKDPSNSENMNSPSDNLASQHSQELTGTIPVSVWCMVKQSLCLFSPSSSLLFLQVWLKPPFKENQFVPTFNNVFYLHLILVRSQPKYSPPELQFWQNFFKKKEEILLPLIRGWWDALSEKLVVSLIRSLKCFCVWLMMNLSSSCCHRLALKNICS